MKLFHTTLAGRGQTDRLLADAVALLERRGVRLLGTVQQNGPPTAGGRCAMDLRLLPTGTIVRISEDRGPGARGCHMDAGALEQAVPRLLHGLASAELVVLNKFGKQEAQGKGLVPLLVAAAERGLPILVGVNRLNLDAFLAFADGLATELAPDAETIAARCLASIDNRAHPQAVAA